MIYLDDPHDVPSVPVLVHEMDRDAKGRAVYEYSLTQCDGAVLGTEGLEYDISARGAGMTSRR